VRKGKALEKETDQLNQKLREVLSQVETLSKENKTLAEQLVASQELTLNLRQKLESSAKLLHQDAPSVTELTEKMEQLLVSNPKLPETEEEKANAKRLLLQKAIEASKKKTQQTEKPVEKQ